MGASHNQSISPRLFGSIRVVKATIVMLVIVEIIYVFIETRNDFANGILFLLDEQTSLPMLSIFIILTSCAFIFGGIAGKEIIVKRRNHWIVGIKFSVLTAVTICLIIFVLNFYHAIYPGARADSWIPDTLRGMLHSLFSLFAFLPVWLWSAKKIYDEGASRGNS